MSLQAGLLARDGFAAESGLAALLDSLKLKPDAHQTCLQHAVQWMQEIGVRPPCMHMLSLASCRLRSMRLTACAYGIGRRT
jgi:hypothetical protein